MAHISDIKLIRTDTTLDLSQKAEKERCTSTAEALRSVVFSEARRWSVCLGRC
uniref:Uncharacterized protein n=1 Tax=Aegilops tauschii subsp. strangulata TaxID=200361 RepID=A0A453IWW0_AEGTS